MVRNQMRMNGNASPRSDDAHDIRLIVLQLYSPSNSVVLTIKTSFIHNLISFVLLQIRNFVLKKVSISFSIFSASSPRSLYEIVLIEEGKKNRVKFKIES